MGCVGKLVAVLFTLALIGAGIAVITWATDSCTVDMGTSANLTMQGWGSNATCQKIETSGWNTAFKFLDLATLGRVNAVASAGTPQGNTVCEGWLSLDHVTVRDMNFSLLHPISTTEGKLVANLMCGHFHLQSGPSLPNSS